jgi:F-type H+-transporting ATPase subunit alpha
VSASGRIVSLEGTGLARADGLDSVMQSGVVSLPRGAFGIACRLERGSVLLATSGDVRRGDEVTATGRLPEVAVSSSSFGAVVDVLGRPFESHARADARAPDEAHVRLRARPSRADAALGRALPFGVKVVDALVGVPSGASVLLAGDEGSGKTTLALDALIHLRARRGDGWRAVYVGVGTSRAALAALDATLARHDARAHVCVVAAPPEDALAQALAPWAGRAIGEHVRNSGGHALVVIDDLVAFARARTVLSAAHGAQVGLDGVPSDLDAEIADLLDAAGARGANGSLTTLQIVAEARDPLSVAVLRAAANASDRRIFLSRAKMNDGLLPPLDLERSTIVRGKLGGSGQLPVLRRLSGWLALDLAEARAIEDAVRVAPPETIDVPTKRLRARDERARALLSQLPHAPVAAERLVVTLHGLVRGNYDRTDVSALSALEARLDALLASSFPTLLDELCAARSLSPELEEKLARVFLALAT